MICDDPDAGETLHCDACGAETTAPSGRFSCGSVIADYLLLSHIADGDMGQIFLSEELSSGRKTALKILSGDHTYDAKFIVRFIREGRFAAKHRIPYTVDVYSVGEEDGVFYYAMEYVEGQSLADRLRENERIPVGEAITIVEQVASVLAESWKLGRIVHRSIKPDNILISGDGHVKLADYGLARDYLDLASRSEEEKIRLVQYVSPECLYDFSMNQLDSRSDIYSLGAVFYHMVTGRPPQAGFNISEIISGKIPANPVAPSLLQPEVPESISNLIMKMLSRNPRDRFQNAEEFLETFRFARLDTPYRSSTTHKSQKSFPAVTVKMKRNLQERTPGKTGKPLTENSKSHLDSMRKERETRSQTIVLLITLCLLMISVFFVLFIRWLVYEPKESVRRMELNIERMKEQAAIRKNLHRPLKAGAPELLFRGVVAFCTDEDFVSARRFLREFIRRYPVDPAWSEMLTYHVNNASIFFQHLCYGRSRVSGIQIYSLKYGRCRIVSVDNAVIDAENSTGGMVQIPIRTMNSAEYMKYLHLL